MKFLTLMAMFVLALCLTHTTAYAQQYPQEPPSPTPQAQQPMDQDQTTQAPTTTQPQVFMGKIVKEEGSLALKDEATSNVYKIDNEDLAKEYVGKSVRVTGTLDSTSNTIHVTNIEAPSKM
jgi:hypothetical protein